MRAAHRAQGCSARPSSSGASVGRLGVSASADAWALAPASASTSAGPVASAWACASVGHLVSVGVWAEGSMLAHAWASREKRVPLPELIGTHG